MMDWTDRHCRYFHRLLTPTAQLYTEMLTAAAVVNGDRQRLLAFHPAEQPVALQLGGSDPALMAEAARIGAEAGYGEININVGCPSDRVRSGAFGACLMAEPERVRDCWRAMSDAVNVPVTVKTRIGIDDQDSAEFLDAFVRPLADAGLGRLIVHARIAILTGLSPKENRSIPPLNYPRVYALKECFPDLEIVVNGGITGLDAIADHLQYVDGVMIGREAYNNPYFLARSALRYGALATLPSRARIVERMRGYVDSELDAGVRLNHVTRHMLGLYAGCPGARAFRRHLSRHAHVDGAGSEVLAEAAALVPETGYANARL